MTVTLHSKQLSVQIKKSGAEVCSVKNTEHLEFIWQADKEIWPRHAPVLFPIVGKLKDDHYFLNDRTYTLHQHGFARDKDFELIHKSDSTCTLELRADGESKKIYPFDFIFQIRYELIGNSLITHYKVNNPSEEILYFSVGAHPGFNCPLLKEEAFEDYYLQFESSHYDLTELNKGLRRGSKMNLDLNNNKLKLSSTLFDNDALVFENSQINKIVLASKRSNHQIILESKNWPYFGIWSKQTSKQFVCLEPWYGIADKENSSQQFFQKDGLIKLEAKREFNCHFSITFQ